MNPASLPELAFEGWRALSSSIGTASCCKQIAVHGLRRGPGIRLNQSAQCIYAYMMRHVSTCCLHALCVTCTSVICKLAVHHDAWSNTHLRTLTGKPWAILHSAKHPACHRSLDQKPYPPCSLAAPGHMHCNRLTSACTLQYLLSIGFL